MASNAKTVFDDLVALGLPRGAAAGVVGNLVAESNVNPTAVGDGGTSGGIAQWHNARWTALKTFAANQRGGLGTGSDWRLLSTQEGFLVTELKRMGLWDQLKGTQDVNAASALITTRYEIPKDAASKVAPRQAISQAVLRANGDYSGSADTSKAGGGVVTPGQVVSSVTDPIVTGLQNAASTLGDKLGGIVVKGLFVLLGVGLVAAGVVKATGAGGKVSGALGAAL